MVPILRKRVLISKIIPVTLVVILLILLILQLHNAGFSGADVQQMRNKFNSILDKPRDVEERTEIPEIDIAAEDMTCKKQFGISWFYSTEKNECLLCEEVCGDLKKLKERLDPCVMACQIYSVLQIARKEMATIKNDVLAAVMDTHTKDKGLKETLIEEKLSKLEEADETSDEKWRILKTRLDELEIRGNGEKTDLMEHIQKVAKYGGAKSKNLEEALMMLHGTITKAFILIGVGFVIVVLVILFVVVFMDKIGAVARNLRS